MKTLISFLKVALVIWSLIELIMLMNAWQSYSAKGILTGGIIFGSLIGATIIPVILFVIIKVLQKNEQ